MEPEWIVVLELWIIRSLQKPCYSELMHSIYSLSYVFGDKYCIRYKCVHATVPEITTKVICIGPAQQNALNPVLQHT